jgi:hypothetical protein
MSSDVLKNGLIPEVRIAVVSPEFLISFQAVLVDPLSAISIMIDFCLREVVKIKILRWM